MEENDAAVADPKATRSKAWVYGLSLAGIAGSNPAGGWMSISYANMCFDVEVSAVGRSLVQRCPIEYGVSKCDL